MKFVLFTFLLALALTATLMVDQTEAHGKHKEGHVKIKVWRGPSHGHKKHKHAPFGYHFSVEEKGHH